MAIGALTSLTAVQAAAAAVLSLAALYVLCCFPAFQLDGIFIGAIRAREMRNTSILSIAVFLAACWPLATLAGNPGLWLAFVVYVCARAAALRLYYPALRRSIAPAG